MGKSEWTPRFETLAARKVAGLNETYTYATANKIPELWQKFGPMIGNVDGQIGDDFFGIVWNEKPGIGFDYLACVRVEQTTHLSHDLTTLQLPEEQYAVFTHPGDVASIPQSFMDIWENWLPNSPYEPTGTSSYERYTKEYDPKTQKGGIEFWIPVRPAKA